MLRYNQIIYRLFAFLSVLFILGTTFSTAIVFADDKSLDTGNDVKDEMIFITSDKLISDNDREHAEQAEHGAAHLVKERADHLGVDAGRHDERAQSVDREHGEREEDPLPELLDAADVLEAADHPMSSTLPPASSILRRAAALARCTVTVRFLGALPPARSFTGSPDARVRPRAASAARSTATPSPKRSSTPTLTIW